MDKTKYDQDLRLYRDLVVAAEQYNRAVVLAHNAGLDVETRVDQARIAPTCHRPITLLG